jgi:hypothetical protein
VFVFGILYDQLFNLFFVLYIMQQQATIQGTQSRQVDNVTQHQVTIQGTQSSQI